MTRLNIECGSIELNGTNQLIEFGLPVKKGLLTPKEINLYVTINDKYVAQGEAKIISFWPCGSIKWLHLKIVCSSSGVLKLVSKDVTEDADDCRLVIVEPQGLDLEHADNKTFKLLSANNNCLKIDEASQTSPQTISLKPEHIKFYPLLKLKAGSDYIPLVIIESEVQNTEISNQLIIKFTGKGEYGAIDLTLEIQYCFINRETNISLRIHNSNAAQHKGNTWDLGDPNSVYIDDLSMVFEQSDVSSLLMLCEELNQQKRLNQSFFEGDFELTQYGSGGENWKSPVHWDENKKSTVKKQGFELSQAQQIKVEGLRSRPLVGYKNKDRHTIFEIKDFWQNFPISAKSNDSTLRYQLLHCDTELQGGESKTWYFKLTSCLDEQPLDSTLEQVADSFVRFSLFPAYFDDTLVFAHIRTHGVKNCLAQIIEQGIVGSENFFQKRERIDEYGWRNFGDLYADHEVAKDFNGEYFVSHYNNQYDPLYGMALQYLITSNPLWLDLVEPLSLHVQDIDIYDTDKDKGEYNCGLMWHTDHYLTAETCTHRSNSKHHSYAYDGFLGGGGPGGQHCYTTGLLWQYLMFADIRAKEKVLKLTNWVRRFYNGSGSFLERTFRLLTIDLKNQQLTMIGRTFSGYRYPLDRGTGNFLIALIDSYEITTEQAVLDEVGFVIRNTVHPLDDLEARGLKNVEDSWFYTVFFQAVVRYLFLKESINEIDEDYHYSRQTFMHYANWMLLNEDFYLDKPEILEFPNDTWCAQDIRKANLFYYGYYFSADKNADFIEKADTFYEYVTEHLSSSSEQQYTRILSILMQNDGVFQMFNAYKQDTRRLPSSSIKSIDLDFGNPPNFGIANAFFRYLKDMIKLIPAFSLKKEWNWFKFRVNKFL